jgi:hypothetical protein
MTIADMLTSVVASFFAQMIAEMQRGLGLVTTGGQRLHAHACRAGSGLSRL